MGYACLRVDPFVGLSSIEYRQLLSTFSRDRKQVRVYARARKQGLGAVQQRKERAKTVVYRLSYATSK